MWLAINKFDIANGVDMPKRENGIYLNNRYYNEKNIYHNYCFCSEGIYDGVSIKRYDTVLYNKNCQIIKLVLTNQTNQSRSLKVKYCDNINEMGYFGISHNIWVKSFDFCAKKIFYYRMDVPFVVSRYYNGIGLQANIRLDCNEIKTIFIYKAKDPFCIDKEDFNNALFLLRQSKKITISTNNKKVDELINNVVPSNIIRNFLYNPFVNFEDFDRFVLLNPKHINVINLNQLYLINKFDVNYYFNLIALLGVVFCPKGILVKDSILQGIINIKSPSGNIILNIGKSDNPCVIINGVVYCNFKQFSYTTLANKEVVMLS